MSEAGIPKKSREEIAAAYKSEPWWYDVRGFFILTFAYNSTIWQQLRFFGPNFGQKHLELACGTGTLLALMLRWRRLHRLPQVDVIGVDYAESMLAGARYRFRGKPLLKFVHADAADLPFERASFDSINIANSLHCFPDVDGALREACRVLKPGGVLAANVLLYPTGRGFFAGLANRINRWGIKKGILYTPYRVEDVRQKFLENGFLLMSESVFGNCYSVMLKRNS